MNTGPIRYSRALLGLFVAVVFFIPSSGAALPEGNAPPALGFPHFPDRQHAFVWRNWNLVELTRLATVLGTTEANVEKLAASMGLPPAEPIQSEWRTRGYLTLIRRNWHLLPYDQLLTLLDVSAEQLEQILREDDFLFIKLGNHKPKCERLSYTPPDAEVAGRAAKVRRLVETEFGDKVAQPGEPRFAFLQRWEAPVENPRPAPPTDAPRFVYSYAALFGDPLLDPSLDPFPDGLLQELADRGVNGVWLHVVLRDLAPGGESFPEFGAGHEKRLDNLRALVNRAARFGVRVYLYVNEPRAMPSAFFNNRQQMAGVREGDHVAMCTSDPAVRRWIGDALAHVFKSVPHLGGAFSITVSENFTSCASHFNHKHCPRCKDRSGAEVVAEVNATVEAGVHRGNVDAKVIAWDWGWPDDWAAPIIAKLPKNVWLQSVSEWSMPITRGGVRTTIGEYCMSAAGPGPRATRHWKIARDAGLKTSAKVQLNNTWELSAVPNLPVMDLVAEHCANLSRSGVDGMMLSWSLGGYPSPNLEVAARFARDASQSSDTVLNAVARERYGEAAAPHARRAWTLFSEAFREYPYDGGVIYTCPVQFGPANLLHASPTGYAATMIGFPYDDLNGWRGPYSADVFASQFEKVAKGWEAATAELNVAADEAPADKSGVAREDFAVARAAGLHFRSVANQARFVMARDAKPADRAAMRRIIEDEVAAAKELFALTRQDSRIGFEASNHYYYVPQDLVEKVINCRSVAERAGR